ncbi:hypothetical protein A6J80_13040 [Paracoccus yeei]|uniref:Uncharacterized protein n=1 Tax=Paracoccus yeei TaxID=147645 RepID=A0A1V0GTL2_9RHOB|nr:hypothetical protein A6J80_13040 [Paracoccus yeei]
MRRAGGHLLIVATLAFVASLLAYAMIPHSPPRGSASLDPLSGGPLPGVDIVGLFLRPPNLAMGSLMALAIAALLYHAAYRLQETQRLRTAEAALRDRLGRRLRAGASGPPPPRQILELHRRDDSLAEHAPAIIGLVAGAVWPWLFPKSPLAAFLVAAVSLAGFLAAALRGTRQGKLRQQSNPLGFVAGWATMVTFALFIALLQRKLGAPLTLAATVGLALAALAALSVQLRMGRTIGFSLAVLWGLVALAASTVTVNAALATLAVLAIAVIVFGLVQAAT